MNEWKLTKEEFNLWIENVTKLNNKLAWLAADIELLKKRIKEK